MPVDSGDLFYRMDHEKRGVCLIINNENFFVADLDDRKGTQVDRDNLVELFESLGFEVIARDNLRRSATMEIVKEVAERDHSKCDCFVMFFLSHGDEGILWATDASFKHEQIFSPFTAENCPSLAGKPKLYFLQVCQGSRLDAGLKLSSTQTDSRPMGFKIHIDFLVACATVPGYLSWRNTEKGSWFIQSLVFELQQSAELHDLLTILTFVNRRVAINFESNVPAKPYKHAKKQVPSITFMLTKLVKFSFKRTSPVV